MIQAVGRSLQLTYRAVARVGFDVSQAWLFDVRRADQLRPHPPPAAAGRRRLLPSTVRARDGGDAAPQEQSAPMSKAAASAAAAADGSAEQSAAATLPASPAPEASEPG